jgi:ADP-ribosyl-[dinitrogen reductase] hydrolase
MPNLLSRYRGALLGLAAGDALGTTVEFSPPGSFPPVTDMVGGGVFNLKAGEWTDDTSMALCLAESLVERGEFDPRDQMERYVRWMDDGYYSVKGFCFDIGGTTSAALKRFKATGEAFAGVADGAGNGSLMRLAPAPLAFGHDADAAIRCAADSSRTTHGAPEAIDACRYMAALIVGALAGATKDELISPLYAPIPGIWNDAPLCAAIAEVAGGSFLRKQPPAIRGAGYVVPSLEAALWAFANSTSFREGCLLGVNLGDDADTTGAVYGQLAGAFYGEEGIPATWRAKLAMHERIMELAEGLYRMRDTP